MFWLKILYFEDIQELIITGYGKDMKYDEQEVERLYQENLSHARQLLASLPVAEGRQPTTKGLI